MMYVKNYGADSSTQEVDTVCAHVGGTHIQCKCRQRHKSLTKAVIPLQLSLLPFIEALPSVIEHQGAGRWLHQYSGACLCWGRGKTVHTEPVGGGTG